MNLHYLTTEPSQSAKLKAQYEDFVVRERLGYEMSGEGEFVALYVRKTDANTLFVGEKLAAYAGVSARNMSYAGLKDRRAVTEQWFCLQMPGKETPDFSQFQLEGVEILGVTRHSRKIRIGSLQGNEFDILLRGAEETDDLKARLDSVKNMGFPNYFTEQRFGREGNNLTQALCWARGEIQVKDRNKRSFYLSAARSELFNKMVSARIQQNSIQIVKRGDVLQLEGSHSWFCVGEEDDLISLQQRLDEKDLHLAAPLLGDDADTVLEKSAVDFKQIFSENDRALLALFKQERMKTAYRPMMIKPQEFCWKFEPEGLRLNFYLPAGSYATALVRELVNGEEPEIMNKNKEN